MAHHVGVARLGGGRGCAAGGRDKDLVGKECEDSGSQVQCRNLVKRPWAFAVVLCMNPNIFGVVGTGSLHQVPTFGSRV